MVPGFGLASASFAPLHEAVEAKSGLELERGTLKVRLGLSLVRQREFANPGDPRR